jgi:hypothetical protein
MRAGTRLSYAATHAWVAAATSSLGPAGTRVWDSEHDQCGDEEKDVFHERPPLRQGFGTQKTADHIAPVCVRHAPPGQLCSHRGLKYLTGLG